MKLPAHDSPRSKTWLPYLDGCASSGQTRGENLNFLARKSPKIQPRPLSRFGRTSFTHIHIPLSFLPLASPLRILTASFRRLSRSTVTRGASLQLSACASVRLKFCPPEEFYASSQARKRNYHLSRTAAFRPHSGKFRKPAVDSFPVRQNLFFFAVVPVYVITLVNRQKL